MNCHKFLIITRQFVFIIIMNAPFWGDYFRFHNKGFLFIKNLRIKEFLNFTL